VAANPGFFNGAIQVLTSHEIADDTFTAAFATTDFASFVHWRGLGKSDTADRDCFGCAILRGSDGAILLGVQATGNLNAGRAYCPGGFIDPADVQADGTIDIDGSIAREIGEETGLTPDDLVRQPGYILTAAGISIAIGVEYRSPLTADALRAKILQHLATDATPELADVKIMRRPGDIAGIATSNYVRPLLTALL
jgi:8-oxo-dGTP pyrophosphatase MutT (NUDIX family)